MTLVLDRRAELDAGDPACHALIVGVSEYANLGVKDVDPPSAFGLYKLTSAALTCWNIYRWLEAHKESLAVQLATCRLLLAPSPDEIATEPALGGLAHDCSFASVRQAMQDWRDDCSGNKDNFALLYFCGHGIQRTGEDSVLLLEDFDFSDAIPLQGTVSMNNIFFGMAPGSSVPDIARSQLYFIDACREFPQALKGFEQQIPGRVFNIHLSGDPDDRRAPIFFAAIPGARAYARIGRSTVFSDALLACLEMAATRRARTMSETSTYEVGSNALEDCLKLYFDALTAAERSDQEISPAGLRKNVAIHWLPGPPSIPVTIELVPVGRFGTVNFAIEDGTGFSWKHVRKVPPVEPITLRLPQGTYSMDVKPDPAFEVTYQKMLPIKPPRFAWKVFGK